MTLSLFNIMQLYNNDIDLSKTKLIRHTTDKFDFKELVRSGLIEKYQSYQGTPVFHTCDYIIVFIADGGMRSILHGIYKIALKPSEKEWHILNDNHFNLLYEKRADDEEYIRKNINKNEKKVFEYKYTLDLIDDFKEIYDRIVVEWASAAINWQVLAKDGNIIRDQEILEIYPKNYAREFPGFLDFILDFKELRVIIKNPDANKLWHQMLSSVAGIYLIRDRSTGKQYVGSAYGKEGILNRWKTYVDKNMKENKDLIELSNNNNEDYKYNFSFTILRTLPKTLSDKEVIKIENFYKEKLGSKEYGLNCN